MFPDEEPDPEAVARMLGLPSGTLLKFLMVAYGDRGQWYWTTTLRVEEGPTGQIELASVGIPFTFTQTVYGMQLFDDRGWLVESNKLDVPRFLINGDDLQMIFRFQRVQATVGIQS